MSSLRAMEDLRQPDRPELAKRRTRPLARCVAQPTRPFRVIELITLLVIAGLIVAVALPRCGKTAAAASNQPLPASAPASP